LLTHSSNGTYTRYWKVQDWKYGNNDISFHTFGVMKFRCGQMWIAYISDYGSAEKRRNRKTGINHYANLRNAVRTIIHKYTGGRIKIHATAQQKMASASESIGAPLLPRAIHIEFIGRSMHEIWKKNDLFGNMSALYIVMEHTSGKRRRVLRHLFSLRDPRTSPFPHVPFGSHTPRIFIFITTTYRAPSWVNRFLVTSANRFWRDSEINKSGNLSYFPHSSVISVFINGTYILINFTSRLNIRFLQRIFCSSINFYQDWQNIYYHYLISIVLIYIYIYIYILSYI